MPLYDYECHSSCGAGHQVTEIRSMAERDEPKACPHCPKLMRRIVSLSRTQTQASEGYNPGLYTTQGFIPGRFGKEDVRKRAHMERSIKRQLKGTPYPSA